MKKPLSVLFFSLFIFLCGCDKDRYDISLQVKDGRLERKAVCSRASQGQGVSESPADLPQDAIKALSEAYEAHDFSEQDKKHIFSGGFLSGTYANGMGGSFSFSHYPSLLGEAFIYMERVMGSPDVASKLESRLKAADTVAALLSGWLSSEATGEALASKIKRFFEEEFRADLRNGVLYGFLAECVPETENKKEEMFFRIWNYAAEKGYVAAEDIPHIARGFSGLSFDDRSALLLVRRALARKLEEDEGTLLSSGLAFLSSADGAGKALSAYLEKTPEYARLSGTQEKAGEKADPMDVMGNPFSELIGFNFDMLTTYADIRLDCGRRPFSSNGDCNESGSSVIWNLTPDEKDALPEMCYALWSIAEKADQEKLFGRVILENENLWAYVLWESSLPSAEKSEWSALLSSLDPSQDIAKKLADFRFSSEIPASGEEGNLKPASALSETGRNLILQALKATPPQPAE